MMVVLTPSSLPASAIAWAWLPDEDAGAALVGREIRDRVESTAELEGTHALKVLALEVKAGARGAIGGGGRHHRRAVGDAFEGRCGRYHVGIGGKHE